MTRIEKYQVLLKPNRPGGQVNAEWFRIALDILPPSTRFENLTLRRAKNGIAVSVDGVHSRTYRNEAHLNEFYFYYRAPQLPTGPNITIYMTLVVAGKITKI